MAPSQRATRRPAADPDVGDDTVQRNFHLPVEQAEWLRTAAFHERVPQTELVREALADLRRKYERRAARRKPD